jgi:WhiB family redox-sensing transcriptional regulator
MKIIDRGNRRGYGKPQRWVDRTGGPTLRDLDPTRWHNRAACRDLPSSLWLDDYTQGRASRAVLVCRSCPVQRTCLAAALVFGDEYGICGGTTTTERANLAGRLRRGEKLGEVLDGTLGSPPSPRRIAGAA